MIKVLDNQWLGDVVLQASGSLEGIVDMAVKNNISITGKLEPGTLLREPDTIRNRGVVQYYKDKNIRPATWITRPPVATITFDGNGGTLLSGDETVKVPLGTLWKDVPKPVYSFGGAATKQGGFTYIQNDDNTVIDGADAVQMDMTVYASFTVIEIGVITHNGEIMSAQGWIDKYGDPMFIWTGLYWSITDGEARNNLIEWVYFKLSSDKAIAYPSRANLRWLMNIQALNDLNYAPSGVDWWQYMNNYNGFDAPRFDDGAPVWGDGTVIPSYLLAHPLSYDPPYPLSDNTKPLNLQKLADLRAYDDGKNWFNTMRSALAGVPGKYSPGTPFLDKIAAMTNGNQIRPGDMRIASPYELSIICSDSSKQKMISLLTTLMNWSSVNAGSNRRYFGWTYQGSDQNYGWGSLDNEFFYLYEFLINTSYADANYLLPTLLIVPAMFQLEYPGSTRQQYVWPYGSALACWDMRINDWGRLPVQPSSFDSLIRLGERDFLDSATNGYMSIIADVIHLF